MAFSFSTVPLKPEAKTLDMFEMATITNDLMTTVESLGAAERNFAEVQGVVENVNQSLNLIAKFGQNAIHQLNLDGGLEALVGVKEQLITTEKAIDALNKCKEASLEDLKQIANTAWEKIKGFFETIFNFFKNLFGKGSETLKKQAEAMNQKAEEAAKAGTDTLHRKDDGKATEAVEIKTSENIKSYLMLLSRRLGDVTMVNDQLMHVVSSSTAIVKKYEPTKDYQSVAKEFDPILHSDASYLVKADDSLKQMEMAEGDELSFDFFCHEISVNDLKSVSEQTKKLADALEELHKKIDQVHKESVESVLLASAFRAEIEKGNKMDSGSFDVMMTLHSSVGKQFGRLARYSNKCFRAAYDMNSRLLDFTVDVALAQS